MSDNDEDDYAFYGTPLPPLDPAEVGGANSRAAKPIPIEEQTVTDERGRRRFHGAFTGTE